MAERKWYENPDAFKGPAANSGELRSRSEGPRDYVLAGLTKMLGDDHKAALLAQKLEPVLNSPQFLYDFGKDATSAVSHALNGHYEAAKDSGVKAGIGALSMAAPAGLGRVMKGMTKRLDDIPRALADYIPSSDRAIAAQQFMEGSHAPPLMYMGRGHTRNPGEAVTEFSSRTGEGDANVAGWAAYEPRFAERFAGEMPEDGAVKFLGQQEATPALYPLKVRATNPFDIAEEEHRKLLGLPHSATKEDVEANGMFKYETDKYKNAHVGLPKSYTWKDLERHLAKIREKGFDSYYDYEHGTHDVVEDWTDVVENADGKFGFKSQRNKPTGIAVFNSSQLKSPFAEKFDPREKNIGHAKGGAIIIDDGNPAKRRKLI